MICDEKIRVLVVDCNETFRKVITKCLALDNEITVVGAVNSIEEMERQVKLLNPDIITVDTKFNNTIASDVMHRIKSCTNKPVIVVSNIDEQVFDSIKAGASSFIDKPNIKSSASIESFIKNIIIKVKQIHQDSKKSANVSNNIINGFRLKGIDRKVDIIAIGSSTGGTEALAKVIKCIPKNTPPIVVVQHIPPKFSKSFADRLNSISQVTVKEAENGDYLKNGTVYIAPGDKHMRVVRVGDNMKIECFLADKVSGHCPSVDVLFNSVANHFGKSAVGVILTGMGCDGAKGLLSMRMKGAYTIGQDEASSVVYGMPKAAFELGAVYRQLPLLRIVGHLYG